MAAKAKTKKLYTFQSPDQLMAKNPWGDVLNQAPTQADILSSAMPSPMSMSAAPEQAAPSPVAVAAPNEASPPMNMDYAAQYLGKPTGMAPNMFENKAQATNTGTKKVLEDTYLSPEEYQALVDAAESVTPVQEQKKHLQDLESLQRETLAQLPVQKDESAMLGLIDDYTGSKMSQRYKAPMTPEARAQLLLSYGEKTKKDREALLKDVLSSARYMKSGTMMDQTVQSLLLGNTVGRAAPRPQGSGRGEAIDDWKVIAEGNKANKDYLEGKKILDTLDSNLGRGDLQGLRMSLSLAARQLGGEKGVLTDNDIARVLPNVPGLTIAGMEGWLTNNPNVLVDRKVTKGLKELSKVARERLKDKSLDQVNTLKASMAASPSFAGKTNRLDAVTNAIGKDSGPKSEPTIAEMIRERIKNKAKQ